MNAETVIDANIAIAVLNPDDVFHEQALKFCWLEHKIQILNVTKSEALIYPEQVGKLKQADEFLKDLGIDSIPVTDDIATTACTLRAKYGNRKFPMIDALVVACGVARSLGIVTTDAKWPKIPEANIQYLAKELRPTTKSKSKQVKSSSEAPQS